jgi:hypothetical protein
MIKWTTQVFFFCLVFSGCQQKGSNQSNELPGDTARYYPAKFYLEEQIRENDIRNLPRTIRYSLNGKKSENELNRDSFLLFSRSFLDLLENFSQNKYRFNETVMHDLSTQSYTLSYRPLQANTTEIDYLDVLLNEKTQLVKRMDIRRSRQAEGKMINEHFSWRTDKGFLITRVTELKDSNRTEVIDVSWEPNNRQPL